MKINEHLFGEPTKSLYDRELTDQDLKLKKLFPKEYADALAQGEKDRLEMEAEREIKIRNYASLGDAARRKRLLDQLTTLFLVALWGALLGTLLQFSHWR